MATGLIHTFRKSLGSETKQCTLIESTMKLRKGYVCQSVLHICKARLSVFKLKRSEHQMYEKRFAGYQRDAKFCTQFLRADK